jgi:hypothetical protein
MPLSVVFWGKYFEPLLTIHSTKRLFFSKMVVVSLFEFKRQVHLRICPEGVAVLISEQSGEET